MTTTTVKCPKEQGKIRLEVPRLEAQAILCWSEQDISLLPRFIMGKENIIADFISYRYQIVGLDVSRCSEEVAGHNRPVYHIAKSSVGQLMVNKFEIITGNPDD